jgi:hypothetical protein
MKRLALVLLAVTAALFSTAPGAQAALEFKEFDLTFQNEDGSATTQAGSHPFAVVNQLEFDTTVDPFYGEVPTEQVRDLNVQLPAGLVGDPGAIPRCSSADFINFDQESKLPNCSNSSAVGTISVHIHYKSSESPYQGKPRAPL